MNTLSITVPTESPYTLSQPLYVTPSTTIGTSVPWMTTTERKVGATSYDTISINFGTSCTSPLSQAVTFTVTIVQDEFKSWCFYEKGIEIIGNVTGNCQYDISSEVSGSDTLSITISNLPSNASSLTCVSTGKLPVNMPNDQVIKIEHDTKDTVLPFGFRYVMEYKNGDSTDNGIYMSQDPSMNSRR